LKLSTAVTTGGKLLILTSSKLNDAINFIFYDMATASEYHQVIMINSIKKLVSVRMKYIQVLLYSEKNVQ